MAARHLGPQLGRTVMLAPPNGGSELATRLGRFALIAAIYGPAGAQLGTAADRHIGWGAGLADCLAWPADRPVLVIAGTRSLDPLGWALMPKPNDGKVSVASTRLPGAAHLVIPATHTFIMRHPDAVRATVGFLVEREQVETWRLSSARYAPATPA